MHDLHERLTGRQRGGDLHADGPLTHAIDELLHHFEGDVRLEQGASDFAQRLADVLLGQPRLAADDAKGGCESITEVVEHGCLDRSGSTNEGRGV